LFEEVGGKVVKEPEVINVGAKVTVGPIVMEEVPVVELEVGPKV